VYNKYVIHVFYFINFAVIEIKKSSNEDFLKYIRYKLEMENKNIEISPEDDKKTIFNEDFHNLKDHIIKCYGLEFHQGSPSQIDDKISNIPETEFKKEIASNNAVTYQKNA